MNALQQIQSLVNVHAKDVARAERQASAQRDPLWMHSARVRLFDVYHASFLKLEEPLALLKPNDGEGAFIPTLVLELPRSWLTTNYKLKQGPLPDEDAKPGLVELRTFFKIARAAFSGQFRNIDEEVLAGLSRLSQAEVHSAPVNARVEAAHAVRHSDAALRQLLEAYRVEAGDDPEKGPWTILRPQQPISTKALARFLNDAMRQAGRQNAIWPNYLEERMPEGSLEVREYKATLWRFSGNGDLKVGDKKIRADRDGHENWLKKPQRQEKLTPEDQAAILAGLYFAKTNRDFFLDGWGRVAGSRALAFSDLGGVNASYSFYYAAYADHDLRAVGSPESQFLSLVS